MAAELSAIHEMAASGDVAAAIARCQAARAHFGPRAPILARLGALLARQGNAAEARDLLERVLAVEPDLHEALFALGSLSLVDGRLAEAASLLDRALSQDPENPAILLNRGLLAVRTGESDAAMDFFRRVLANDPCNSGAADTLFHLLVQRESYDEALALAQGLIARQPDRGRWWRMRGFLLFKRYYEPEEAERCFARAEISEAGDPAYWTERGICARDRGDLPMALDCFERGLAIAPENALARFHRGLARLYAENYTVGWPDYESRFADASLRTIPLPGKPWQGEALAGARLLVVAEQGLGDEIMFASCLGNLPTDGRIALRCAARLEPIFRASFPACEVFSKDAITPADWDDAWSIAAGSLPRFFRNSRESFPRQPYLRASDAGRDKAREFIDGLPAGRRIGISWRGGTENTRRRMRTMELADVARLLRIPDTHWVSLQYGDCTEDLRVLEETHGVSLRHPQDVLDDYDATAALVERLDLVVTVCTAIVHLAGALGKEVWVLAPKVPEWRYGLHFRFMPWYRQVEILRQADGGDWSKPLEEVIRRLT